MGLTLETDSSLESFLAKKVTSLPEVVQVIQRNTAEMQAAAQRKAPVDTGFLKRSIYLKMQQEGTSVVGEVGADASYDPYQEYGTRFMPAQHHLRPAYYEQRDKFLADIHKVVTDD